LTGCVAGIDKGEETSLFAFVRVTMRVDQAVVPGALPDLSASAA